jgi:hypothetical protein
VDGVAASGKAVAINQKTVGELLGISFGGGGEVVSWEVQFEPGGR